MFDRLLRPLKDRVLAPVAKLLGSILHPNVISLLSLLPGVAAGIAAAYGSYPLALALWVLNRFIDGLDGAVARHAGLSSDFGGYLDIMIDLLVYAVLPIGLACGLTGFVVPGTDVAAADATAVLALPFGIVPGNEGIWLVTAILLAAFYVNLGSWMYLSALLEKRRAGASVRGEQTSVTMPDGLVGGFETIVLFALMLGLPSLYVYLAALMACATLISAAGRLLWGRRHLAADNT